jgi:hypothetical protein
MNPRDPDLSTEYQKDPIQESFLESLNDWIVPHEDFPARIERYPTLHVVGVPRSGTTLYTQLVARHLDVGYINHLTAAFWKAPVTGMKLSMKVLGDARPTSLTSDFGRTRRVEDPHEFGYFWRHMLKSPEFRELDAEAAKQIDWDHCARVLINMTYTAEKAVVFKSFQLGTLMSHIQAVLPKTCFVWIRRDPVETARSILKLRERFFGDRQHWASIKPLDYQHLVGLSVWEQVAGQVVALERSLRQSVAEIESRNVLEVSYEKLCRSPIQVIEETRALLCTNGPRVAWTKLPRPIPLTPSPVPDDEDTIRIKTALLALKAIPKVF